MTKRTEVNINTVIWFIIGVGAIMWIYNILNKPKKVIKVRPSPHTEENEIMHLIILNIALLYILGAVIVLGV
jgi:nitric oxide reductase large subunit